MAGLKACNVNEDLAEKARDTEDMEDHLGKTEKRWQAEVVVVLAAGVRQVASEVKWNE